MKKVASIVLSICLVWLTSCGGASVAVIQSVHAGTPDCTPEFFFDGPQNAAVGGILEGPHTIWMVTPACVITTAVNTSFVTQFDHTVQMMTIQMGSNQDSVFEWDQVVTVTTPAGDVLINQQQQYDKHIDDHGNKQERYPYMSPIHIPGIIPLTQR